MHNCTQGHHCCWVGALVGVAWLLVSSGLLTVTWNKVFCSFAKLKPAKYWQALLLLTTICVLCVPCAMMRHHHRHRMFGHGWTHGSTCPYAHDGAQADDGDQDATDSGGKPTPGKK